ncbi:MAG: peptide ABC transporter substrate-binding protein [Simkaniaceae bacterium]|nr:peptide ABC transporter substrate-binding protein [Simkaniaceae bacterium]
MKSLSLLLIIPLLFSCAEKEKKQEPKQVIKLAFSAPVQSLDPRNSLGPSTHLLDMLYEGLMRLGPKGEIIPGVAESFTISEDQKTYTFKLRNSYWSNGDPVTAYDFEYAWKKSVSPLQARESAFLFYAIKNVKACLEKKVGVDDVGIVALDEKTLKVELEHPAPYFLALCVRSTYAPIRKGIELKNFKWGNGMNENFVTNGPFLVKRWKEGEIYVEKNPSYWDSRSMKIDGIQIVIVPDGNTQFLLYEKGELDWVGQPTGSIPPDIRAHAYKKGELQVMDAVGLHMFFLNSEKPPFNNKNFRKALAYAIDRQSLVDHIFQLGEKPAMGILNADIAVTDKPYFENGNIELAKKHLDRALLEMGMALEDLPTLTLSQRDGSFNLTVNQAIQQQLHANLGLHVEIDQLDFPVHMNQMIKGDYEIADITWSSVIKDPSYTLNVFRYRNSDMNVSFWEHLTYQDLLKEADEEIDLEKRREHLHLAEMLLMEEMPVIPLCFSKIYFACNKHLKGVYISSLKEIDFRYAYFE